MDSQKTLNFKCLAFNKAIMISQHFKFVPDQDWREFGYFTVNGESIKINYSGAWTCVIASQVITSGIKHFSIKIKKGTHLLPGFVCQDEIKLLKPMHSVESYNVYYVLDGTTISKGTPRHSNRAIKADEIIHSIYDMNNGIISFVFDSTG